MISLSDLQKIEVSQKLRGVKIGLSLTVHFSKGASTDKALCLSQRNDQHSPQNLLTISASMLKFTTNTRSFLLLFVDAGTPNNRKNGSGGNGKSGKVLSEQFGWKSA